MTKTQIQKSMSIVSKRPGVLLRNLRIGFTAGTLRRGPYLRRFRGIGVRGWRHLDDERNLSAGTNNGVVGEHGRDGNAFPEDLLDVFSNRHQVVGTRQVAGHAANDNLPGRFLDDLAKAQGLRSL